MKKIFAIFLVGLFLVSCSPKQKLAYFDDLGDAQSGTIGNVDYKITLEPADELAITVTSEVPEATIVYNLPVSNPALKADLVAGTAQPRQQTYIVDNNGNINFPVLGRVKVAGLSTSELCEKLTREIAKDVEAPYVRVELVNFKVKVMGEVGKPDVIKVDSERFSVLDALAAAGDMTVYGRRDNVLLLREENGVKSYHRLNLNDSRLADSPYFYLKQNDVVYVVPGSSRSGQAEYNQNNAYKVSVVSAIVSGISVIASLIIALVINKK